MAVSTLSGVAFAETDAEKIKRLESELQQYKEISAKYNADLNTSHQKYQEYRAEMDDSFVALQQKLTQQSEASHKIFETEEETLKSGLEEEVKKTSDVKNDLGAVQTKIQNLENKEKQLQNDKNNLINDFNADKAKLEQELLDKTKESTDKINEKVKELDASTQKEAALKKQIEDMVKQHMEDLTASRVRFKEQEAKMIKHYKTVGSALEDRLKIIARNKTATAEQLRKNIEDIARLTDRLKV